MKQLLTSLNKLENFKESLTEFFERETCATSTKINYLNAFKTLLKFSNKKTYTEKDLIKFRNAMTDEESEIHKSSNTASSYFMMVRKILVFLNEKFGWNQDFMKVKPPKNHRQITVEPSELIKPEEVETLISHCKNDRDKTLIALLYETGLRISEALNIKLKDVEIKETHINIYIRNSKTAKRNVTLVNSQPYLISWLNNHPFRDDKERYLFITLQKNEKLYKYGQKLSYWGAFRMLKKLCKRAGMRDINLHLFRHTAATKDALEKMNPKLMNKKYGWSPQSKTPLIYINISDTDLEQYELENKGIIEEEKKKKEEGLKPRKCPRCYVKNVSIAKFCINCGSALSEKVVKDTTEERLDRLERMIEEFLEQQDIKYFGLYSDDED